MKVLTSQKHHLNPKKLILENPDVEKIAIIFLNRTKIKHEDFSDKRMSTKVLAPRRVAKSLRGCEKSIPDKILPRYDGGRASKKTAA